MRTVLLSCLIALAFAGSATAALAAEQVDWTANPPTTGEVVGEEVYVTGTGTHRLITIHEPETESDSYVVRGTVRHEGVGGAGYLEMWSYFADGGAYFSRTLAEAGPMAALVADSDGRQFELPFFLNGAPGPDRVEINVVMPEGGQVWVGPLTLEGLGGQSAWWSENQAALIGGFIGVLAGLSGAAIGIFGGRRQQRKLVESLLAVGLAIGIAALIAGAVAFTTGQPRHVWYPLALVGTILTVVDGALMPTMRRAYTAAERHRMRALDA